MLSPAPRAKTCHMPLDKTPNNLVSGVLSLLAFQWTNRSYALDSLSLSLFVAKCLELERCGVRFSVGVVGQKQHGEEIEALWITITSE